MINYSYFIERVVGKSKKMQSFKNVILHHNLSLWQTVTLLTIAPSLIFEIICGQIPYSKKTF